MSGIVDVQAGETEEQALARHRAQNPMRKRARPADSGVGVFRHTREEYDAIKAINWSSLKHLARSPAHYMHALTEEREDTDALRLGRCAHLAIFEPERYEQAVAVWQGERRAGKEWEAFKAANASKEIVRLAEHEQCVALSVAIRTSPTAAAYLDPEGMREATVQWQHVIPAAGALPATELACKGRLDKLLPGAIVDLKTTKDASRAGFARQAWNLRYHTQAAYYVDGVQAATGKRLPYVIIAAETTGPMLVQVYVVPDRLLDLGREEYRALLERLAYCQGENEWPGYADGELELDVPPWAAFNDDDENAAGLGLVFGEK